MSRQSAAKRSLEDLRTDQHLQQQDDLRRGRLVQEQQDEAKNKRQKTEENDFISTWERYLKKWSELGLQCVHNRQVTLYELAPQCAPWNRALSSKLHSNAVSCFYPVGLFWPCKQCVGDIACVLT